MKKYIGLDVHLASTTMVIVDENGKVIQTNVQKTDSKELRNQIASISGRKELALEEGTMANWLAAELRSTVDRLIVCDPAESANPRHDRKSDELDATRLAQLLRMGQLKPIFHPSHSLDALRSPLKTYQELTQDTTRCKNRIKASFRSRGIATNDAVYKSDSRQSFIEQMDLTGERTRLGSLFDQLDYLQVEKKRTKNLLFNECKKHRGFDVLTSVPGIGPIYAAMLLGIVVTPHRFRNKRQFWSYCGLAVSRRSSADWADGPNGLQRRYREQTLGLNRKRHPLMKYVFKQAAMQAMRCASLKNYYRKQIEQGRSAPLARVIVARKLAAITLRIWKENVRFDSEFVMS